MRIADWYHRALLTIMAGSLLFIAFKLQVLSQRAQLGSDWLTGAAGPLYEDFGATAVSFRQAKPARANPTSEVLDVRIVGLGGSFDGSSKFGLPVSVINGYMTSGTSAPIPIPVYYVPPPK